MKLNTINHKIFIILCKPILSLFLKLRSSPNRELLQSERSRKFSFDVTESESSCESSRFWMRKLQETRNKLSQKFTLFVDRWCTVSHPHSSYLRLVSTMAWSASASFPMLLAARVASSPEPSPISCLVFFSLLWVGYINDAFLNLRCWCARLRHKRNQPVCLWVSGHGQRSQRALVSVIRRWLRVPGARAATRNKQTSECTRKFLGARNMQPFALCGLFVHGEPPSILMFVLDLYFWFGPQVLAFL